MSHEPGIVVDGLLLGRSVRYTDQYDCTLLQSIARAPSRRELGIEGQPLFSGADLWTAYELSWLNRRGKPQLAIAHIMVPCESTHLVESKSFKLYLNSYSGSHWGSAEEVRQRITDDLNAAAWQAGPVCSSVVVRLVLPERFGEQRIGELAGVDLDRLDLECTHEEPAPELLTAAFDEKPVEEVLASRLLRSNCPVTGQPDWGSVQVSYSGPQINQAGLLRYIVSLRRHSAFHEQCVERIFTDIWTRCRPSRLAVHARYTRRGGLDINPWRTSHPGPPPNDVRTARQ